jgi:transcriptional regulator with XRE-family HTH domain
LTPKNRSHVQPTGDWLNQPGGLAERLERMRKAAGLTGERMAAGLSWPRSKISKLENGRQMPTAADVTAWAASCGQPDAAGELLDMLAQAQAIHRQYRHQLRRGHAAMQGDLDQLVRHAQRIRNFEVMFIPGLIQTPDYARYRMLEAVRVYGAAEDGVETAVAARMHRQEILYDTTRHFEFIIMEVALQVRLCPPQVMLAQLDRLLGITGLANVTLGIIPLDAELTVAPEHGFLMADDVTYVETHASEIILRGEESAAYERIADGLNSEAVSGDLAQHLITSAAARLRQRY